MTDPAAQLYEHLLILRCQAGDESALTELIARYSPGLRFFLARLTSDSQADDLLQETWIDVYRKINRLQSPLAFPAWLYRIARDKAYRELRRRHIPIAPIDDEFLGAIPADDEPFSPSDAQAVREALTLLPLPHREILTLRFIEDLTYEQIAEVIGLPVGTVRSRLHYAKLTLREKLQRTPIKEERP